MNYLLDNITWHTLVGPHAKFAAGAGGARRYASGFSPILGFADPERPDFEALTSCCETGESFYTDGWAGAFPKGWSLNRESTMFKMVWAGKLPLQDEALDALRLGTEHAAQALELALLTQPGPFGPRTIELGEYFGYFDDDRLIAMAGERMFAGEFHEVSGICTHPDFQGRGLAKRLTLKLIRRQMQCQETPFLHVMSGNAVAHDFYLR